MSIKSRSLAAHCSSARQPCFRPKARRPCRRRANPMIFRRRIWGEALRQAADVANIELYAASEDIAGKTAPAIKGELTAREAIEALLAGSGLQANFDDRTVVILNSASAAITPAAEPEAIIVTGSRIAGAPAAAPVIEIKAEDIRNAGQADLGEVARSLPQNFGGGQNPGIGNTQGAANENVNANGASTFNLRGIGPNATLTLINGKRFAYSSVNSVDRRQRHSDRRGRSRSRSWPMVHPPYMAPTRWPGWSIFCSSGTIMACRPARGSAASTDGGNFQQQYNLLGGSAWSEGGIIAAYDYSRGTAIRARDRSYAGANNPDSTLYPDLSRHALFLSGHQSLGGGVTLAADLIYKRGRMRNGHGLHGRPATPQRGARSAHRV